MVNVLISGGGVKSDTRLAKLIVSLIPRNGRLLYIPVAMPTNKYSFGQCYDWVTAIFRRYGLVRIDMMTDLSDRKYEDIAKYSAVFIGGGNTFHLLNLIRKTGFDRLLVEYIKSNKPVYGGSAGAILLGKDIGTAYFGGDADKNEVGIKDLKGLNFVKGYSIACHQNKKSDVNDAMRYSVKTRIPTISLPDGTGLHVKGKRILVVGPNSATVFKGKTRKVFKAGSLII